MKPLLSVFAQQLTNRQSKEWNTVCERGLIPFLYLTPTADEPVVVNSGSKYSKQLECSFFISSANTFVSTFKITARSLFPLVPPSAQKAQHVRGDVVSCGYGFVDGNAYCNSLCRSDCSKRLTSCCNSNRRKHPGEYFSFSILIDCRELCRASPRG